MRAVGSLLICRQGFKTAGLFRSHRMVRTPAGNILRSACRRLSGWRKPFFQTEELLMLRRTAIFSLLGLMALMFSTLTAATPTSAGGCKSGSCGCDEACCAAGGCCEGGVCACDDCKCADCCSHAAAAKKPSCCSSKKCAAQAACCVGGDCSCDKCACTTDDCCKS